MIDKILSLAALLTTLSVSAEIKRAIVVGASSGMGRQVAKLLAADGYEVGLVARRTHLLQALQDEIPTKTFIKTTDISKNNAKQLLAELIEEMGGLDLMLISINSFADFNGKYNASEDQEEQQVEVDLKGFVKAAQIAIRTFEEQKSGHLVGITSISV